ncbi:hypothetical protein [Coleofasciculus sp.]
MMPNSIAAIATVVSTLFMIQARPIQAVPITRDTFRETTKLFAKF